MKKIVSLVLAMVLMASMFAMLGTFTASAATYEFTLGTKTISNLTFDSATPYGVAGVHGSYGDSAYENGYAKVEAKGGLWVYFGKDETCKATPLNQYAGDADKVAAKAKMFFFEAGKTYRITFNYKQLAGSTSTVDRFMFYGSVDPLVSSGDRFALNASSARVSNYTETIENKVGYTLTDGALAEDTPWRTVTIQFDTAANETGFTFSPYIYPSSGKTSLVAFDNWKIEEIGNATYSYSYKESKVYENPEHITGALWNANAGSLSWETYNDAEMGDVIKMVATGNYTRATISNADFTIEKNMKYYISFDAKGETDGAIPVVNIGARGGGNSGQCYWLCYTGTNSTRTGYQFYENGVAIPDGVKLSTEWKNYGIILDTSDEAILASTAWNGSTGCFLNIGATNSTVYYDNFQIFELSTLDTAVPSTDDASPAYSIRAEKSASNNNGKYQSAGLRFRGFVDNDVKAAADEIGVVVVPSYIAVGDSEWYNVKKGVNQNAKTAVWYEKDSKDLVYNYSAEQTAYQLILTNLTNQDGKKFLSHRFAAVMYVKTGDTYTYYSLGETSYNETKAKYAVKNIPLETNTNTNTEPKTKLNVLMIGNSFCYYFPDELYGLAEEAGYELTIGNLYYPGCYVQWHWEWLQEDAANYEFFITDKNGRHKTSVKTLQASLDYAEWDVISLQQHMSLYLGTTYDGVWNSLDPYTKNLYDHIKANNPEADLYWQETWAFEVGFNNDGISVPDAAFQAKHAAVIKQASQNICLQNNVKMIPSGDAWQIARTMEAVGDNLCQYTNKNDKYHDGDIGGGQYLNACVWFEVLLGKSCLGNSFIPDYELSAEKRAALQLAAHQAVAEVYGYEYAQ